MNAAAPAAQPAEADSFDDLTQEQRLCAARHRAQLAMRQRCETQNALYRQATKANWRRFSDEPVTGFGGLTA